MVLAKSNGITLEDHNQHVQDEATRLLDARPYISKKYLQLAGKDLRASLKFCVRWHDEGKRHFKWQDACQADFELWKRNPLIRGTNLIESGIRHEMHSLVLLKQSGENYTKSDLVAIAAHHKKLSKRFEHRWEDETNFLPFWEDFLHWGSQFRTSVPEHFEDAVLKRYLFDGPRAMLQLADQRASAAEGGDSPIEFTPFEYTFRHQSKRGVQTIIEELWDEPLAILRAPTGAGKTDAALLWAQHQILMGRADRLVIAMPTRFTSNALYISAAENLGEVGVYHSTSYFNQKKHKATKGHFDDNQTKKENELARLLETPVTVTTLDHLCIALTGTREDHHSIFWAMAHSCVVIDEADFYDQFTQYNLITLLRVLRVLQVRVLIMSATVPASSQELYALSKSSIAKIHEDASDLERPRCQVHFSRSSQSPDDIADLLQPALDGTPTIIYANTVKRAQAYRDWFLQHGFEAKSEANPEADNVFVMYHSRFTEPDKAKKEAQLIEMLGKEAWAKDAKRKPYGVAILTQIGELSVNISADYMISDLCPIDRLAQRAGRLSRFCLQIGQLHVVIPTKVNKAGEEEWYPAPYGTFEKEGWQVSGPLARSREWLQPQTMTAQGWIDGVNVVYPKLELPDGRTRKNQDLLEKNMIINWLIVPTAEVAEDDEGTKEWKSRDVPAQKEVYVPTENPGIVDGPGELHFKNWRHFREWETESAISVLAFEVKPGFQNGKLEKATVFIGEDREDTQEIFITKSGAYSFDRGLVLTPEQDEIEDEWSPHDDD